MPEKIRRAEGRTLFGMDPEGYDSVRPEYPPWVYVELRESGALFAGAATLEIGPGSGLATRLLIEGGASPLTLVEPDVRFAGMLARVASRLPACRVLHTTFEEADLADGELDLVVAATSFHWIDPERGMRKLRAVLREGGTAALVWNVFQDLDKPDAFHDATADLLSPLAAPPSGAPDTIPFALDRRAREADAEQSGFGTAAYSESRWSFQLTSEQVGKLYEGFSPIQRLEPEARTRLLDALMTIAESQFGGTVERNVTTCLYRFS